MMTFKYRSVLHSWGKAGVIAIVIGGVGVYQVFLTRRKLLKPLPLEILESQHKRPTYIYTVPPNQEVLMTPYGGVQKPNGLAMFPWQREHLVEPHRLLHLAKYGDEDEHLYAIQRLSNLQTLSDADYYCLAQHSDLRTSVALARTKEADLRFFRTPPPLPHSIQEEDVSLQFQKLLSQLPQAGVNECVQFITQRALQYFHTTSDEEEEDTKLGQDLSFEEELLFTPKKKKRLPEKDLHHVCLLALLSHSTIPNHCQEIAKHNGLQLLMKVYNKYHSDSRIISLLARILANLAMQVELHLALFRAGWVGVLARWSRDEDIHILLPAARALANLDQVASGVMFSPGVYLLHPQCRDSILGRRKKIDVVFVHGLLGRVFKTWRQHDSERQKMKQASEDGKNKKEEMIKIGDEKGEKKQSVSSNAFVSFISDVIQNKQSKNNPVGGKTGVFIPHLSIFGADLSWCTASRASLHINRPVDSSITENQPGIQNLLRPLPNWKKSTSASGTRQDEKYTECWPKDWLPWDCPHVRVIGVDYETHLSHWQLNCATESFTHTIRERSDELLMKLHKAGIGECPIVWVGHSMGGLLIKQMLITASCSEDQTLRKICQNTTGSVMYSVPHHGTSLATLRSGTQMLLLPSVEVQELRQDSKQLQSLHESFLKLVKERNVPLISFGEMLQTEVSGLGLSLMFVHPASSDPGVGEYYQVLKNHLDVCKPENSRDSILYWKLVDLIKRVAKDLNQSY